MPHDLVNAKRGTLAISSLLWFVACSDDTTPSASAESSSSGESTSGTTMQPTTTSVTSADTSTTSNEETATSEASSESTTTAATETTTTDATESSSSTDATESSSTNAEESSESGMVELECPVADLDPDNQDPVFGNTTARDDDFSGSCGGDGSPDVGFTFTAPADGIYTFDTSNSQLDTVLYLLDGVCSGSEIACDDNGDGSQSVITVPLTAAQTVTAIVDGNSAGGAPFSLRVRAGDFTCPAGDLGSVSPTETIGDSSDAYNSFASTCGGYAGPEDGWLFTAPVTATYTIDTFNSSFTSVVHVNDGVCGGAELACGSQGSLVDLVAGQQVTIFVDGPAVSGAYELHVDTLGGACPDQDLGNTVPQTIPGDTSDGDNTDSSTCGGDFSPDDLYTFTAPEAGLYTFDTFGSDIDTIVFVRSNDCDGAELACNDDVDQMTDESRVLLGMGQDQTVLVGVDGNE
ncbi:MAG TPA: hypothetical protein VG755_00980, partial [Nannocystaceae bacterium]|nr:hypothetical protein [Nannocystaceae bacterium]